MTESETIQAAQTSSFFKTSKRNMHILNLSEGVSAFGTSIFTFAAGLYVLRQTGSGTSYALTLCMNILAVLLMTPISGLMADFFSKKKLLLICDFFSGLSLLILSFILIGQPKRFPIIFIYVITFFLNAIANLYNVTLESAKSELVEKDFLLSLNSVQKILDALSGTIAPVLGGIVFAIFPFPVFLLFDGITFFFSACCKYFLIFSNRSFQKEDISTFSKGKSSVSLFSQWKEGILYIQQNSFIRSLFSILLFYNIFLSFSITVPVPYYITTALQLSSQTLGFVEGFFTFGIITGSIFISKVSNKFTVKESIRFSFIGSAFCMLGFFLLNYVNLISSTSFTTANIRIVLMCFLMFLLGNCISWIDIPLFMELQLKIPAYIRGRVFSQGLCIIKLFTPLALLLSGVCLNHVTPYPLFFAGFLGLSCFLLYSVFHSLFK